MKIDKTNLYLLAIVGIVALVGIVVLVLNAGTSFLPISEDDLSGQAYKASAELSTSSIDSAESSDAEGDIKCCRWDKRGKCTCHTDNCNKCWKK